MGFFGRIFQGVKMGGVQQEGRKAGHDLATKIDEKWLQLKIEMHASGDDPPALKARFLGWMQGLHGHLAEINGALLTPDAEFREQWRSVATILANRFRSEVLLPTYGHAANEILSDADIAEIVADIDAAVASLRSDVSADKDELLDRAVSAVRAAEAAGKLARDPRPDAELKDSIRRMWEQDASSGDQ